MQVIFNADSNKLQKHTKQKETDSIDSRKRLKGVIIKTDNKSQTMPAMLMML